MDIATIATLIGTGIAIIGFVYAFLRNFKIDINSHIDRLEKSVKDIAEENKRTNMRMDGVYHILLKRTETNP